jgi:hypothetical protein
MPLYTDIPISETLNSTTDTVGWTQRVPYQELSWLHTEVKINNSERDRHPDRFEHSIYFHKSTTQGDLTATGTKIQGGISDLFKQTVTSTYFLFNGKYYDQKDGIAMGSPPAPTVAHYFMENIEKQALDMAPKRPTCWYRYMDDTFVMRLHGMEEVRFNSILTAYMQILSSLWK